MMNYEIECVLRDGHIATLTAALEKAREALEFYYNEENWSDDRFTPSRLEPHCKCLRCYETYSDKGEEARTALLQIDEVLK